MKKIFIALITGCVVWLAQATESLWMTDLIKAQAQAKAESKLVLVAFTGSDWCPPCKALHKNVMTSPEFVGYAKTNLVLVEVDFPHSKPQSREVKAYNEALAKHYDVDGFPTVIVLDGSGKQVKKSVGYGGQTPAEYIASLQKLKK